MKTRWKEWMFLLPAVAIGVSAASGLAMNTPEFPVLGVQQSEQVGTVETEPTAAPTTKASQETGKKSAKTAAPKAKKVSYHTGSQWKDGTYTGSGTGFGGSISVQVRIQGGKLTTVRVTDHAKETPAYYEKAKAVIARILKAQSPNVDTVSGATYSSRGLCEATANALQKAGGTEKISSAGTNASGTKAVTKAKTTAKTKKKTETKKKTTAGKPVDGTYTGSAVCDVFDYRVRLKVRVRGGKVVAVYGFSVTGNEDEANVAYYRKAWKAMAKRILKAQSGNVDAVSGATYSSDAIVQAYQNAYEKAVRAGQKGKRTVTPTKKPRVTKTPKPTAGTPQPSAEGAEDIAAASAAPASSAAPDATMAPGAGAPKDGTYTVSAWVRDLYGDFEDYLLQATVTFQNGLFTGMDQITAKTDATNLSYCTRAEKGTSKKTGVIAQLQEKQDSTTVDAVSGATCSSKALLEIYTQARQQAIAAAGE